MDGPAQETVLLQAGRAIEKVDIILIEAEAHTAVSETVESIWFLIPYT